MESCTIGTHLGTVADCHKGSYTGGKTGLSRMCELDPPSRDLICWRSGCVDLDEESTVCLHHSKIFLDRYASLQKHCCDPFDIHPQSKRRGGLREINTDKAKLLEALTGKSIKPGQKWCPTCVQKEVSVVLPLESQNETDTDEFMLTSDVVYHRDDRMVLSSLHAPNVSSLNQSLIHAGFSPINPKSVSKRDIVSYGKRKCNEVQSAVSSELAGCLDVPATSIMHPEVQTVCSGNELCADMIQLVDLLKEKMKVSSRQKQIQMLTLAPQSWSIAKTIEEFQVSEYKVREARKLLKDKGVLGDIEPKLGRPLAKAVEERIKNFYYNDEYSRLMPGAKDYKSVRDSDGKRVHRQKRLILMNLNELYENYRMKYPEDKVGLSKFCMLRPQECVTVGCRGTHSVCVCTIHQNVKLMVSVLPGGAGDYHDLMKCLVCSTDEKLCMIHRCANCPNSEALRNYLESLFEGSNDNVSDQIHYKQWVTVDYTSLQDYTNNIGEFIDILVEKVEKLTCHHYIAKHQSRFLTTHKESLQPNEAIIILDFAENYSFIVQDAAQGFHWNNSQATLHPFVAYYKDKDNKLCHSSMCVISDHLQHSTVAVHCFQQTVLQYLKVLCPLMTKVLYFSDGAASQYKNYKNFANLVSHQQDFSLDAEWHFFATSHGKNACDGVGGTVKREASKASLKSITKGHILTPMQLYEWGNDHLENVKFFYIPKEMVVEHEVKLHQRFQMAKTVPGTRNHHCYIPTEDGKLSVRRISGDDSSFVIDILPSTPQCQADIQKSKVESSQCMPGQYVACMYDEKWWVGNIRELCHEENDVLVNFMHPNGPARSFSWPAREDTCWVPLEGILCFLSPPVTRNGRQYHLEKNDVESLAKKY
jgi:hypothetical protein